MFLLNSCSGHFSAASRSWLPLSLTYGVNLPSSLTMILPIVLGFSPHLPVSVCGTGALLLDSSFSRQLNSDTSVLFFPTSALSLSRTRTLLSSPFRAFYRLFQSSVIISYRVPASLKRNIAVQEFKPAVHRLRHLASP